MKKQVILGLTVMVMLIGVIGSAQAGNWTNFSSPVDGETIGGNYTLNATTDLTCDWVSFNYSIGNVTPWYSIGTNNTQGTVFTTYWNTTELCDGNYTINASSNRTGGNQSYVNITVRNNVITLVTPTDSETISSGNYTFNATTTMERLYVNFSWSNDSGATWTKFASNNTPGTVFTAVWNTTGLDDGTYDFNASTNCTVDGNTTERSYADDVVIDNVEDVVVDSPEFSTVMIAGLIGLLSATAILLRKKKE